VLMWMLMLQVFLQSNGIIVLGIPRTVDQRDIALFRPLD